MKEFQIKNDLFRINGKYEFIFGLTKDLDYYESILAKVEICPLHEWEPYELNINSKSKFIIAIEKHDSNSDDLFCNYPEYISKKIILYEMEYSDACKFLGELLLLGNPSKIVGFSLLKVGESIGSRLDLDCGIE